MDWQFNGVKIVPAGDLDPNTPQTPGMTRAAAITHARTGARKLWAGTVVVQPNAKTGPMFTAYFDASGTAKTPVITVAGFVSRVNKWGRFTDQWKGLLPPTVSSFHMTDFVSNRNGWESWKGKTERRVKLIADLVACIKSNTNQGFAGSVRLSDYNKANDTYELDEFFGAPYVLLGIGCLGRLKQWADNKKVNQKNMLCIFEDGDKGQGLLIKRARSEGFNAITQTKENIRAFDACDLAAWKSRTLIDDAWEKQLQDKDPAAADRIMRSLSQIETVVKGQEHGMYSVRGLEKICEILGVPKRPGGTIRK